MALSDDVVDALDLSRLSALTQRDLLYQQKRRELEMRQYQAQAQLNAAQFGSAQGLQGLAGALGQSIGQAQSNFGGGLRVRNETGIRFSPETDAVKIGETTLTRKQMVEGRTLTFYEKLQHETDKWLRHV